MQVDLSQLQHVLDQIPDRKAAMTIALYAEITALNLLASRRHEQELKEVKTKILPDIDRRIRSYSPKWLTTKEACDHIKVRRTKLQELIAAGLLVPERRSGSKNLFSLSQLDNYLALPAYEVRIKLDEWKQQNGRGKLHAA